MTGEEVEVRWACSCTFLISLNLIFIFYRYLISKLSQIGSLTFLTGLNRLKIYFSFDLSPYWWNSPSPNPDSPFTEYELFPFLFGLGGVLFIPPGACLVLYFYIGDISVSCEYFLDLASWIFLNRL